MVGRARSVFDGLRILELATVREKLGRPPLSDESRGKIPFFFPSFSLHALTGIPNWLETFLNREQVRFPIASPSEFCGRSTHDPEYPPPPSSFFFTLSSFSLLLPGASSSRGKGFIVPLTRCVYALSTLIINAPVSFADCVLTRRGED